MATVTTKAKRNRAVSSAPTTTKTPNAANPVLTDRDRDTVLEVLNSENSNDALKVAAEKYKAQCA